MATKKSDKKQETSPKGSLHRRGDGLGTGKVGTSNRPEGQTAGSGSSNGKQKPGGFFGLGASHKTPGSSYGTQGQTQGPKQPAGEQTDKGLLDLLTGTDSSSSGASSQQQVTPQASHSSGSGSGKKFDLKTILIIAAVVIVGIILFRKCSQRTDINPDPYDPQPYDPQIETLPTQGGSSLFGGETVSGEGLSSVLSSMGLTSLFGGDGTGSLGLGSSSIAPNSWTGDNNTGALDTTTVDGARDKFTQIKGNKKDVMTVMVYMCGTDLESQYGMASSDLQEMAAAAHSANVRFIIYTGGCKKWKTNGISNQTNMILKITEEGKIGILSDNEGSKAMTNPSTLSGFIKYCKKNFSANRYALIFWDHGGGSISGYGYDEKFQSSGSMSLDGINTALTDGGVKFDFIGFDACLMATAETAIMASDHADYMFASEESEPGVGWYYTNWVTKLSQNPSMDTAELGKIICDDFVAKCATDARGQSTTLSVIDLAEFAYTVPTALKKFATATTTLISNDYQTVSSARSGSREFAASSRIDQVDLIHFCKRLNTKESNALAEALLSAVKYNRTSSDMANSYGVSIYFPYRSSSYVSSATKIYSSIGMDNAYSKCIKAFATQEVSGQVSAGGNMDYQNSIFSLLGGGTNASTSQSTSSDMLSGLLGSFLGSGTSTSSSSGLSGIASLISGLSGRDLSFLDDRAVSTEDMAKYISENILDPAKLNWKEKENGTLYITLTKDEWKLINQVVLSVYYEDGEGYIDLGLDNIFSFDEGGNLIAPDKINWLTVNGQFVPYYFEGITGDGKDATVMGYIPALLNAELDANGNRIPDTGSVVRLLVAFDRQNPNGTILGAAIDYEAEDIEVQAKNLVALTEGDTIDFIADYYTKEGVYEDTYMVGDRMTYSADWKLGSKPLESGVADLMYRFTDIYNQQYWSEAFIND